MQLLSLLAQNSSLRCSSLPLHCPSSLLLRLAASRTFAPAGSSPPVARQHVQPNPAPHSLPWVLRHLSTMAEKLTTKVCIIGSGPAAHTAAIYAARAELQPIIFEGFLANGIAAGGQLTTTTDVENFPGFPEGILGSELVEGMRKQSLRFGTQIFTETVTKVDLSKRPFVVTTAEKECLADVRRGVHGSAGRDRERSQLIQRRGTSNVVCMPLRRPSSLPRAPWLVAWISRAVARRTAAFGTRASRPAPCATEQRPSSAGGGGEGEQVVEPCRHACM
jgi:hypothetical protein